MFIIVKTVCDYKHNFILSIRKIENAIILILNIPKHTIHKYIISENVGLYLTPQFF